MGGNEYMKYEELTLDQKISLKGVFMTNPAFAHYKKVMLFWGFVKTIEYFLNDDISFLSN